MRLLLFGCVQDMTGAAQHLRHAKGLDPMITAAKSGLPVDITKVINMLSNCKLMTYKKIQSKFVCMCMCVCVEHFVTGATKCVKCVNTK